MLHFNQLNETQFIVVYNKTSYDLLQKQRVKGRDKLASWINRSHIAQALQELEYCKNYNVERSTYAASLALSTIDKSRIKVTNGTNIFFAYFHTEGKRWIGKQKWGSRNGEQQGMASKGNG